MTARALVDRLVRLAEVLAALGVADDHVLRAGIDEHPRGDLARIGALLLPVGVLGARLDLRTLARLDGGGDVDRRRAADDVDVGVRLGRLRDRLHERRRLGRLDVHLPVSGNDFLAHFCLTFLVENFCVLYQMFSSVWDNPLVAFYNHQYRPRLCVYLRANDAPLFRWVDKSGGTVVVDDHFGPTM